MWLWQFILCQLDLGSAAVSGEPSHMDSTIYSGAKYNPDFALRNSHYCRADVDNYTSSSLSAVVISLNRANVWFGATQNGALVTGPQTVQITTAAGVNWTVSSNQAFVTVSPGSGTGSGTFTISVQSTTLPSPSTQSAVVSVSSAQATNSPQSVQVSLNVINTGSTKSPFGSFDTPVDNTTGVTGAVAVTGWALDDIEVVKVQIWRDPIGAEPTAGNGLIYIGDATFVSGARPDVQSAYPNTPLNDRAGWGYGMLTTGLPNNGGSPGIGN
jgi:hypothetical protein